MADLLECLIQIKALAETLVRLPSLLEDRTPGGTIADDDALVHDLVARLATAEGSYAMALRPDAVTTAPAATSADSSPSSLLERFRRARRANLDLLGRCSAADLARHVEWPGRGRTSAADLVAMMLAHDTEILGELRLAKHGRNPGWVYSRREPRADC